MMRQSAFERTGNFLKGGLHCHTTRSDGEGSPDEVIRKHFEHGYHFLALTDHNIFNRINHTDLPMTILSGIERDMGMPGWKMDKPHCVHIVGIGDPATTEGPSQDEQIPWYGKYDHASMAQEMIEEMHRWGLKTFYCHPEWSGTSYSDFRPLQGCFGMELWNTGSATENDMDIDNGHYWDEALDEGRKIWGLAVDDGHNMNHHCKGWVMVKAENSASSILAALQQGSFYASCGPEIYDFYVEDGCAFLDCSDVVNVSFHTLRCPLTRIAGEQLSHAECKFHEGTRYVRAVVTDRQGRKAWTNPIFLR